MRIALCTNYITPYRLPVFRALADRAGNELTIYTTSARGHDRDWDRFDQDGSIRVVQSRNISFLARQRIGINASSQSGFTESAKRDIPLGLFNDLLRDRPDVIITGELGMRTLIAKFAGLVLRVPVIPWAYPSASKLKMSPVRSMYRTIMLRSSRSIIGMGTTARAALRDQGARDRCIFDAPNSADIHAIRQQLSRAEFRTEVEHLRTRLSCRKKIALVVGRLVEMKAPLRIIEAWKRIPDDIRKEWTLVFVGDGPLAGELRETATPDVRIIGSVRPEEVSTFFAASDLHIFASLGDPWGLVVNEAMHHAIPTLCSIHAGCCEDLVIEDQTGFRFDPTNHIQQVASQIAQVLMRDDLERVGNRARIRASMYTPSYMASGMQDAIDHAIARVPNPSRKGIA